MWVIAAIVIGSLIILGILILSIPFDLAFRLEIYGRPKFNMKVYWLFGLVSRDIGTGKKPRKKAKKYPGLAGFLRMLRNGLDLWRIEGLKAHLWLLLKGLWRCLKIRRLEGDFLLGLDDPAENFYLFALMEPVRWLIGRWQPHAVNFRLSFVEPALEGYLQGTLRLFPISTIPPVTQFILSRPAFRMFKKMAAMRWKKSRP